MKKRILYAVLVLLLLALGIFFFAVPGYVDRSMNRVLPRPPYHPSERAKELHKQLLVADFHADTLLWGRSLLERNSRGHVDLPRLLDGNIAFQAFTIVTKVPAGLNIERNEDKGDLIRWLALAQRWPISTWTSLTERALYQARRLNQAAADSGRKLIVIRTGDDLARFVELRSQDQSMVAAMLGIEGAHALDGDLNQIDALFDAGVRMMAPTHFFDNDIGGSAAGVNKTGLTDKGRQMVRRMEGKRMIVDVAHASGRTIDDVLAMATRPVVVSHTGVKGTCDNSRNLTDDQIKGIARTGGVIGIGYWDTAVCGTDAAAIARAIRYTANLAGVEHVGLGSDFDGAVTEPFDTSGLVEVTDALLNQRFTEEEIKMIMGGNILRLVWANLPPR
jgi:microsomal dipeptidase-like Zn-dependent dipeptidase